MYILLSNDDGVSSPGLLALRQALAQVAEVAVVAPERNWSISGHSRTFYDPLRARPVALADGSEAMACSGTPADCVALAILGLLSRRPDLVVSGINLGSNVGHDVMYSGTVAAAMEGLVMGIPSIAISLENGAAPDADFRAAAEWAARIVRAAIQHQLPGDVLLNVNVPAGPPESLAGAMVCRLGRRIYRDELVVRHDPRGKPYYWFGGQEPSGHLDEGTDIAALANHYVSITPLHFDLTSHSWLEALRQWSFT